MAIVDWRVLSGPRVSRRTLMRLSAATGAAGFAGRLAVLDATAHRGTTAGRVGRQQAKPGGTLRIGFQISQIVTLDPQQLSQGVVAGSILPSVFSGLVQFDRELGIVPDLAETWEVSPDGLRYTFRLRPGLTFHNGNSLTSADVRYTYERATNPDFAWPHANKLALVESFETPDERTVALSLAAPFAPFLAVACTRGPGRALTPVPRRAIEELGDERFGIAPVGSGPFSVVAESVEAGRGFELVAFDGWHGGRPLLDGIEIRLVPEASSAVSALEAGDVDVVDPAPATLFEQLSSNPDLTVVEGPSTGWRGVVMNRARPPWDNPEARLAVAKALDRQEFVDTAFFGLADPAVGAIAPAFGWAYVPPEQSTIRRPSIARPPASSPSEPVSSAPSRSSSPRRRSANAQPRCSGPCSRRSASTRRSTSSRRPRSTSAGRPATSTCSCTAASSTRTRTTGTGTSSTPKVRGIPTATGASGPTSSWWRRAEPPTWPSARLFGELQTLLATDVAAAFAYHAKDLLALHKDVRGFVPVPEQRCYETVWLDR